MTLFLRPTIYRNKVNFHKFHQYSTKSNTLKKLRIQKFIITGSTLFATGSIFYFFINNDDTYKSFASFSLIPVKSTISSDKFTATPIHQIIPQSKTTSIFRLKLSAPLQEPFPVSSCVHVKDPSLQIMREYTPISPIVKNDELLYIDLLVKRYENGQVSRYIHGLSVGDLMEIRGPVITFQYRENMYKALGMICGGTGITPMYQIIKHILNTPSDKTKISLIYANQSIDEILLRKELDILSKKHPDQFKVYYTIDNAPSSSSWNQGIGYITSEMIKQNMPPPSSSSLSNIDDKNSNKDDDNSILILVCGPDGLMKSISGRRARDMSQGRLRGLLKKLGYNENQVFKF
ncbi:1352_t:CDS:2 [Ambispora leptoticha]|uniref:cytochrome-b5 reductase n=1 Tax=Ambispora leptoticha TaxID=144679 RepID=A0A9N9BTX7_9GLOM|nr:1352_t:CDS:2 [Ambispora leptoticha]